MDTWQVEFGCLARDDVFNILYKARLAKFERRSWTRHSLKSSQTERLNCWEQTWNKWISSLKHLKSVPFDFSHFDLSAMVLQEVRTCQLMLAQSLIATLFSFFPSKKKAKKLPNRFPRPLFSYCSFSDFINCPMAGSCRLHWSTTRLKQWDCASASTLAFGWTLWTSVSSGQSSRGNVIPMEVPWIYTNLQFTFKNFLHLLFLDMFLFNLSNRFFFQRIVFFATFRLARCCHVVLPRAGVWWLAGFLRMPRLSALLKAGGAPKRREDRARLRVAKT